MFYTGLALSLVAGVLNPGATRRLFGGRGPGAGR
ncbi:hypothetical protein BH24ACT19_BH24ACT19_06980 [soil metagenome]